MSGNEGNASGEEVSPNKRRIEDYFGGHVNDDKINDSHENDGYHLRESGGEHDKWVQKLVELEILLGNCMYGNCPKCFCIGLPGYPCPVSECNVWIARLSTTYRVGNGQSYYLNPLFIHKLVSSSSIYSCFENQGTARSFYNIAHDKIKDLKIENIPKTAKKVSKEVLSCIISQVPFGLYNNDLEWIEILANSSSILEFHKTVNK